MGLYGTIVVQPADASYWPAVDRGLTVTLDDLLIEDGRIAPFRRSGPTYTAMGRFGNVFLINGQTEFSGTAAVGDVVRLYLVNTANTRIFNVALSGARMKLVGGDSGRYERETFVEEVLLAPSERAVVDVLFEMAGVVALDHRTPDRTYTLGTFSVSGSAESTTAPSFDALRTDPELTAQRQAIEHDFHREPDKTLSFVASMPLLYGEETAPASLYACPMHPDVTSAEPGTCPRCGMALIPVRDEAQTAASYTCPMHPDYTAAEPGTCPHCGMKLVPTDAAATHDPMESHVDPARESHHDHEEGHVVDRAEHGHAGHEHGTGDDLEWEDLMPDINRMTDSSNMIWKIIDRDTGSVNGAMTWKLHVGDRVKIRLINEMESDHPMHHPFHIHGAGRFLILSCDGEPEPNLVWKDTVLVPAGQTVDILLDVTNRGLWMAHCHIAEHAQSGMMFSFDVRTAEGA